MCETFSFYDTNIDSSDLDKEFTFVKCQVYIYDAYCFMCSGSIVLISGITKMYFRYVVSSSTCPYV